MCSIRESLTRDYHLVITSSPVERNAALVIEAKFYIFYPPPPPVKIKGRTDEMRCRDTEKLFLGLLMFRRQFFTLRNDAAPTRSNPYKVLLNVNRMNFRRYFLLNELFLSGIVCQLLSLILEVCHPLR